MAGGTVSLSSYGLVDSVPLEISASNLEYGLASAAGVGYPWLREASLVEPFRETTLRAVGCELTSEVWRYEWEVRAVSGAKSASAVATFAATGVSASHTFTRLGQYEATLRETRDSTAAEVDALARWVAQLDENDVESRSRSMMRSLGQATTLRTTRRSRTRTLYCRYVRRDIRRMSEGDRDNFFSAFLTLATARQPRRVALDFGRGAGFSSKKKRKKAHLKTVRAWQSSFRRAVESSDDDDDPAVRKSRRLALCFSLLCAHY